VKIFVTGALGFIGRALVERYRAGGAEVSGMEGEVSGGTVRMLARRGTYSIDKARRLLGYEPKVDLDEGMRRTEQWLTDRGLWR